MSRDDAAAHVARLDPIHLADLRASGLSDAMIAAMHVESVTNPVLLRTLLIRPTLPDDMSGLVIPYLHTSEQDRCLRAKLFPPMPDGNGGTVRYLQARGSELHVYFPPGVETLLVDPTRPLLITEGEKKSAKATQDGLPCLGLGGLWNFLIKGTAIAIAELTTIAWMRRPVTIVPDSDVWARPDLLHAVYALGRELARQGAVVDVSMLPPAPGGAKVGLDDDYLVAHSVEDFAALTRVKLTEQKAWEAQRQWYESWLKRKTMDTPGQGQAFAFEDPEPWPDAVDGAALLDELAVLFRGYLVLPAGAETALALWVLHTYAIDAAFIAVLLVLSSAQKRSGKTTTLELLAALARRALLAASISPSALFRSIEAYQPTLLVDEADATFRHENEEMRQLLNAGVSRHAAYVVRCVGEDHEPRRFNVFAPKALAAIGRLPDTIEDRAVLIALKRRAPGEAVKRLRRDRLAALTHPLRRLAARWALDHVDALREADPNVPSALNDRAADTWRPLLAIADRAGGEWPDRARTAALALSGAVVDDNAGMMLLADLRDLFEQRGDHIESETVVTELAKSETRPWREWGKARKPVSVIQLARLLKPYGIQPGQHWDSADNKNRRGYHRKDFEDAFSRYLPDPVSEPLDPLDPLREKGESDVSDPLEAQAPSDSRNIGKPLNYGASSGSSGSKRGNGQGAGCSPPDDATVRVEEGVI